MKKSIKTILCLALACLGAVEAMAADAPVKREMRSAWVATVWRLDWPGSVISTTGSTSQINKQKQELVTLLDSLKVNNLNCVNFQVRSRCDAMYKSSYEPWSSDLVATRGMDPGWDPLEYCVQECHKRGMECHAWLNPYRYESVANQWDGTPQAYRKDHPDWLLDVTNSNGETASILNPGKPEVTQRICDVIDEIITNYDVDGVLFDDYFYLSGTKSTQDADLYNAYKAAGGTLSQSDWRRDNVNRMLAAVYKTIKTKKPYLRFGVSPAGIACTSSSVAKKYGISPCPTGSDWQYSDIYSDPIAWISQQSLDFISPQIYWTIGNSTDYDKACKWWAGVAEKWNRHFYSSHSISSLTASSKVPGMTDMEATLLASGPNNTSYEEYANQIRLNRKYVTNDAPGSIFYSCKYLYKVSPLFAHYLKTTVFNTPALVPPMTWHAVTNPGNPVNVSRSGDKLSWTGPSNVRYTVYAVPTSVGQVNFNREVEYMLDVTYSPSFTLPANRLSGYLYAVCTLDRYGNEYSPVFVGASTQTLTAPTLTAPSNGASVEMPFDFTWRNVTNATNYIVEIASDQAMTNLLFTQPVNGCSLSTADLYGLPIDQPLYWRVRACGNNYNDGVSAVRSFTAKNLQFTSPAAAATDVEVSPVMTWTFADRNVTLQIATEEDFNEASMVYETQATGGTHKVADYNLAAYTQYFARLLYTRNGLDCVSPTLAFTTSEMDTQVPRVANPANGGTLYSDGQLTLTPLHGAKALRVEVAPTTAFSSRSLYVQSKVDTRTGMDTKKASEITISNKGLEDGKTYYVRARSQYMTQDGSVNSDYSPVTSFVYSANQGAVSDITTDENADAVTGAYDLKGIPTGAEAKGIVIERRGDKAVKVLRK